MAPTAAAASACAAAPAGEARAAEAPPAAAAPPPPLGSDAAVEADAVQRTCRGACALRALELLRRGTQTPIARSSTQNASAAGNSGQLPLAAGAGALSSAAADALISDHLALRLAGQQQLKDFGVRWDAWEAAEGPGKHSYFAGRAAVLDQMVLEAVGALLPAAAAGGGGGGGSVRVQVVSLGCGVDTRPWRLDLPPGTAWFDVDQAPVLAFKSKALAEAGAALAAQPTAAAAAGSGGGAGGGGSGGGRVGSSGREAEDGFPLKCDVYIQVTANLESPGLPDLLAAAGFDANLPTVFVAEGLCYYLSLPANAQLLREAAAACAARSKFIVTHIPACNLDANRRCAASLPLARLFTVSIDDVIGGRLFEAAGWTSVEVTSDIGDVIAKALRRRSLLLPVLACVQRRREAAEH